MRLPDHMILISRRLISVGEKTYVIDDRVMVKEKYLKMSKEERREAIRKIISEDTAKKMSQTAR